jgi:hypothetical protein
MHIPVVHRVWVEWIISLFFYKESGPAVAGPFF